MKILTSNSDNFLYSRILELLQQIKLVQGGTALSSTLRRHNKIRLYMIEKQRSLLNSIEDKYFTESGLNDEAIKEFYSLQK